MAEVNDKTLLAGSKKNIIAAWFRWHFFEAPKNILKIWKNFLHFNMSYFSVGLLSQTLFSHWRKSEWSYGRGLDFGRFFSVFISNMMSRILGAIVRLTLIFAAFVFEAFIILGGIVVFVFWITMPVILITGFVFGVRILT